MSGIAVDSQVTTEIVVRGGAHVAGEVLMVRPMPGVVGERDRQVHLMDARRDEHEGVLKLLCGAGFPAHELDLLDRITGMPCEECLRRTPRPDGPELPDGAAEPPFVAQEAGYVYEQLADHLSHLIAHSLPPAGKPLPAEGRLARKYGVSLGTARHATQLLRERGLVVTIKSKGTYVIHRETPRTP